MHNRYSWLAAISLAVLLAGCNQAPPTPDTRKADARAIHYIETDSVQAFADKDVDKIAAAYADDASVFIPNSPVLTGLDAIKASLKPLVNDKNFSLSFESTRVDVAKSGDIAYSQGTYTMTRTGPKKQVFTEKGKYVTVFEKQANGKWKIEADIMNADAPAKAKTAPRLAPKKMARKRSRK
jgi:uncharacterized protein (TIGR02246 family)